MITEYQNIINLIKEKKYTKIIVSGPQRSGTTYFADELSKELNYNHYDEKLYDVHNSNKFFELLNSNNIVIQSPSMSSFLHLIESTESLVIFMYRDDNDIFKSEDRIHWHPTQYKYELSKYKTCFPDLLEKIDSFKRSSPMKKWIWENIQQPKMKVDWVNVDYNITTQTKGYIPKEKRIHFKPKQIK